MGNCMKTQAIVIPEPHRVELREVELTTPGPGDVVVRTVYTSISAGTERMLLAGRMPHPMLSFPVVPGYETVGRVVACGPDAPPELEGRWVYVGGARCFEGVNPAWGGQAATLIADHRRVVPLDGVEPRQGVLLALAATALHGIDLLADDGRRTTDDGRRTTDDGQAGDEAETGDERQETRGKGPRTTDNGPRTMDDLDGKRVLVLGQGPVGQIAARVARGRGAWVAVADTAGSWLARATADLAIDVGVEELAAQVGEPVAAIVEATGSMNALASALPLLANGGTILLLGYYDELRLPICRCSSSRRGC